MNGIQYESQYGQDKFIIENVFLGMRNGFFVEIGAGDGKHISNTYVLENHFNWRGLCVECNLHSFKKLKENRKCKLSNVPITSDGREVSFNAIDDYGYYNCLFSSIYDIPSEFKDRSTICNLQSETLSACFNRNEVPLTVDYLSLDIEGGELEILNDFFNESENKFKIRCISVEHNFNDEKRKNLKTILESNLYRKVRECEVDDIYFLEKI